jgi:diamine N-acetyltransferase
MPDVTLRFVTAETVRAICDLKPRTDQTGFVAPNAVSIAQAHFNAAAEFRAVYADEIPVGFVMWRPAPRPDTWYLWRFMIDGMQQGNGYGGSALRLLIDELRGRRGQVLTTSVVLGDAGPLRFYRGIGFRETGALTTNGETELALAL